jgi:hypothetical protein
VLRTFLVIAAALVLAYTATGFLLFPAVIKHAGTSTLGKFLGRNVVIGKVDFNPYTMSLVLRGFRIDEAKGGVFLSGDACSAKLDLASSLSKRVWVFKNLVFINPTVNIVRNSDGSLNFDDLLLLPWPMNYNFRFGLIRLVNGKISFRDGTPPDVSSTVALGFSELAVKDTNAALSRHTISVGSLLLKGENTVWKLFPSDGAAVAKPPVQARASQTKKTGLFAPWKLSFGELALREGGIDFIDSSVDPPVSLAMTAMDIKIGSISSESSRSASVAAHTTLNVAGRLEISGEANPIRKEADTTLHALLRNVDLPALSPYAAKYLGYELSAGVLGIDSSWSIQGGNIEARNKMEIVGLKLGKKTKSKDAAKIPLRLALALIKDSSGKITLNIPVGGTLNDPKVDIGKDYLEEVFSPLAKRKD